jgi:hypothetical protein
MWQWPRSVLHAVPLYSPSVPLQVTGDNDLDWTTRGHRTSGNISAISAKRATSGQVNVRVFHLGKITYDTIVYRSLRDPALPDSFGPPAVAPLFLSTACCETLQIGNVLERQRTLLTRRFVRTASSPSQTLLFFNHNSRPKSLRHLRRCLHEASERCVSSNGSTMPLFPAFSGMSLIVMG